MSDRSVDEGVPHGSKVGGDPVDEGLPNGGPLRRQADGLSRRAFVLGAAAVALGLFGGWVAWGNGALEYTRVEIASPRLPAAFDGFRVAHVSDVHNAEFGSGNAELLNMLSELTPDLIAVTGDLLDSRRTDFEVAAAFAERAADIATVTYATGNHEARVMRRDPDGYASYERRLADAGVHVLHGEAYEEEREGASVWIAGIDDPSFGVLRGGEGSAAGRGDMGNAAVASGRIAGLGCAGADAFTLLLSHRPELFDVYRAAGVDAVLAGHAHGGQFRLPFVGGLYAPNQGLFPRYDAGLFEGEALVGESGEEACRTTAMVVSRGLGNSLFPFRVNNRPEVVLVELRAG